MSKNFWRKSKISSNEKTLWKTFNKDEKEREYNPSSIIGGNYSKFIDAYLNLSFIARNKCESSVVHYGEKQSNRIEIALPKTKNENPILIFIHGGYWQELSIKESFFSALGSIENDIAFASIDYTLAPANSLTEIVDECDNAINWIKENSQMLGVDMNKMIITGSSAGAHLAAMVAIKSNIHNANICGAILVSGIYELEPLIGTSINVALKLDKIEARNNSPIYKNLANFPPSLIAYGEIETLEFKRQSNAFANMLIDSFCETKLIQIQKKNHFDVILELTDKNTLLGKQVFKFLNFLGIFNAKI